MGRRIRRRMGRGAIILLLALTLAQCASPNPVLFTLATVPGQVVTGAPHTIQVRRVGLAGYLDRPGIVRATSDYQLSIATDERWGEPLGGMLTRVLNQDLSQRLAGSTVYADSGAISADPDLILEIDVQRFDAGSDGVVVIAAEVSARPGDRSDRAVTRSAHLSVVPQSGSTADYAAALSRGLGQLADIVAGLCAKRA